MRDLPQTLVKETIAVAKEGSPRSVHFVAVFSVRKRMLLAG
jgi:hypothetical protein